MTTKTSLSDHDKVDEIRKAFRLWVEDINNDIEFCEKMKGILNASTPCSETIVHPAACAVNFGGACDC